MIELVTFFCPYFAKRFGLHESILFELVKDGIRHSSYHKYGKFWIELTRVTWISHLFFLRECEYEQALDNLIKYNLIELKEGKYTINEDFCY